MLGEGGGGCGFLWFRLWLGVWEVWFVLVFFVLLVLFLFGVEVVVEVGIGMFVVIVLVL